ncbi:cysteinyl-tRNA synthetase [Rhodobium orientis]|nr:MJ1477/TM1410 family putative glycoside hydrolase [Rhodobium orientis]MBB4301748.1 cysteinyl-tRNA synthetase [Rhodobium orientis]
MVTFNTQHGRVAVDDWGYRLQGHNGGELGAGGLAKAPHDLIIMDFSRNGLDGGQYSTAQIDRIQDGPGGPAVAAAYISIGEASGFRSYWDDSWTRVGGSKPKASYPLSSSAPDWLGPVNPDWPESRKVRYWDDDWQDILFNDAKTGWLDKIVAQGFDAAYLDIVDAYYYWAEEAPAWAKRAGDPNSGEIAAKRMVQLIVDLVEHARQTNPDFFVIQQNGEFLINDLGPGYKALKAKYYDAVGAIAVEDTYFTGERDENNGYDPDREKIEVLKSDYLKKGLPVFAVDYVNQNDKVEAFFDEATGDGFIPYAAFSRELDVMSKPFGSTHKATIGSDFLRDGDDGGTIKAFAGDDTVFGAGGNDSLKGQKGDDLLAGGKGDDQLFGGEGHDKLVGGSGDDKLLGHAGKDRLFGDGGDDRLYGNKHDDRLDGGSGADTLSGGTGSDTLTGGKDQDLVIGGSGDDLLFGGRHDDTVTGGPGADTLVGGPGDDLLVGGRGQDDFRIAPRQGDDRIEDFRAGTDDLDLRAFDYGSVAEAKSHFRTVNGNAVFSDGGTTVVIEDIRASQIDADDLLV